jgi:hypothetical protein
MRNFMKKLGTLKTSKLGHAAKETIKIIKKKNCMLIYNQSTTLDQSFYKQ